MTSRTAVARSYLLVCFASLTALAGDCPEHEPPPLYDVASVELIPPNLHVLAGSVFELSVRLRDSYGRTLPVSFSYEVEWSVSDDAWLHVLSSAGHTAQLEARQPPSATTPGIVQVFVTALSRSKSGAVTVIPQGFTAPGELIVANHREGDAPSMLLADGQRGTFIHDEGVAFVATALLSDFTASGALASELALFSMSDELGFVSPVAWAPGPGVMNLSSTPSSFPGPVVPATPLANPRTLDIRIWNAATVPAHVLDEKVKYLKDVLERNRAGLDVNVVGIQAHAVATAPAGTCIDPLGMFPALQAFKLEPVVHLMFVSDMGDPGRACYDPPGMKGRVLLIRYAMGANDVLAHELGHLLSLFGPVGHTNGMSGFDSVNIMWGGGASRTYYTLGQLFRMSVDDTSWVNLSGVRPGPPRECSPTMTGPRPCPRLSLPFTPIGP